MHKKTHWLLALGLLLVLGLSGCFSQSYQVRHNPDGTGQFVIETIFSQDILDLYEEDLSIEDAREEILRDTVLQQVNLAADDPNIMAVSEEDFINPSTGALHHIIKIDLQNILMPLQFDEADDYSKPFTIENYGDGTYLFTAVIESLSEFISEEMDAAELDLEEARLMLQGSTVSWQIHVNTFIEGDPRAVYDPANNLVKWEIPMYDALFAAEPIQIFAIYRLVPIDLGEPGISPGEQVQPPQRTGIFDSLLNWLPVALVGVLCLGLVFIVIVVVVIILVVRKRKST